MSPEVSGHGDVDVAQCRPWRELEVDGGHGRVIGVAEFGAEDGAAVMWCHGGPGSRLEPGHASVEARRAGLRLVGVDRPGYGRSTPMPGRCIADGVDDLLRVADALQLDRVFTVGVSTGGAHALGLAARSPERVAGVVACCAVTDAAYAAGRERLSESHVVAVWDAADRDAALRAAEAAYGPHGEGLLGGAMQEVLSARDAELFRDAVWVGWEMEQWPQMFAHGVVGYTDDRRADGRGWEEIDLAAIRCPVIVLHGRQDMLVDPIHAEHTARVVPGATLELLDDHGHFSIHTQIVPALVRLAARLPCPS